MKYLIVTDSDSMAVPAQDIDAAARAYDGSVADATGLLRKFAAIDGAWCFIEREDTGERIGGSTEDALREWLR